jgi:hypothetical protein
VDRAIVEQAVRALAALNLAVRNGTQGAPEPVQSDSDRRMRVGAPPCGSPNCAGCYEVEGGRIHPPRCGEDYLAWLERWEAKGKPQCRQRSSEIDAARQRPMTADL